MLAPHVNELYRCVHCEKHFQRSAINLNWKCPDCGNPICIKVEIDGYTHTCHWLKPSELEVGYIITMDRLNIHEVLNVKQQEASYRIALKQFGVKEFNANDFILTINGAWV